MMNADLNFGEMHVRYRLREPDVETRARLDRIVAEMIDDALPEALEALSIGPHEHLCVREVRAPVMLALAENDANLKRCWADAIAASIRDALARRNGTVARYSSRARALRDMVVAVTAGDFNQAWAWRQLGLWPGIDRLGPQAATEQLVRSLEAEPASIVPLMASLAGTRTFTKLLDRVVPTGWSRLAEAAWLSSGASPVVAPSERTAVGTGVDLPRAADLCQASALARRGLASARGRLARETRDALATLVLMETAPTLAANRPAVAIRLVSAIEQTLFDSKEPTRPAAETAKCASSADASPGLPSHVGPPVAGESPESAIENDSAAPGMSPPTTRFGGLLFLLGLIDDLGLPEAWLEGPLARQPLRQTLHALARNLVAMGADDPAALAFAGLAADAEPPEEPDSREALAALGEAAARVECELDRRLEEAGYEGDDRPLHFVCERRAEILADPGWIEVRLSLQDVSTVIRLAALDLDPGYLPWLGTVVRFVYG